MFDPRTGKEPEITHKGTRIKPIPLRGVLEAIIDYAFITSEYEVSKWEENVLIFHIDIGIQWSFQSKIIAHHYSAQSWLECLLKSSVVSRNWKKNFDIDMKIEREFYWVDSLIQAPLSQNEPELPSPNKLKRKIILKVPSLLVLSAANSFSI